VRSFRVIAATAVVAALSIVGGASRASAESAGVHVDSQTIDMAIQANGEVKVVETIHYDFGDISRHGIFRNYQVRFDYDSKYERVYKMHHIHVSATGASAKTEIKDEGREKILKIGDGNKTVTGEHTYTITYTLVGALNGFSDHDELYWNVVGFGWSEPIDRTDIRVHAPGGVQKVACFTGPYGSTLNCDSAQRVSETEADFQHGVLYPYNAVTVAVALDKGVIAPSGVAPLLDEKWSFQRAFAVTPATVGASLAILLVTVGLVARLVWRKGRDRRATAAGPEEARPLFDKQGGPVQFRPPDGAHPAQVGVLIDESADPLDVTATIVDLGVRGYLTLEEIEKKGLFSKGDWKISMTKPADDALLPYERILHDALFDGRSEVTLSGLKNTFASDLHKVQNSLYADCVKQGWYTKQPQKTRASYLALGIVALLFSIAITVGLAIGTHAALIGVPLILASLALLVGHHWMPARTAKGSAALDTVLGFRQYIATAEADRMKFAEEENIFAKYLPFAIIFGETERWAKVFHNIYGDNPPPGMGWYTPYGTWNSFAFGNFASSMSSFAVQTSGTIVSTPGASGGSGFGGGGFSGGGGGGGGGGSW
jgi:uncharacterized protein (TIGR04222 family)